MIKRLFFGLALALIIAVAYTRCTEAADILADTYSGCVGAPAAIDEDAGTYLQQCLEFRFGWQVAGDPHATPIPFEPSLVNAVNAVRAQGHQCGGTWYAPAAPLKWSWKLQEASRDAVQDMIARGYFGHTAPNGWTARDWSRQRGYPYWVQDDLGNGFPAGSDGWVLERWLADPPHCAPILDARATDVAGYYEAGRWALYLGWGGEGY